MLSYIRMAHPRLSSTRPVLAALNDVRVWLVPPSRNTRSGSAAPAGRRERIIGADRYGAADLVLRSPPLTSNRLCPKPTRASRGLPLRYRLLATFLSLPLLQVGGTLAGKAAGRKGLDASATLPRDVEPHAVSAESGIILESGLLINSGLFPTRKAKALSGLQVQVAA